MLSERSLLKIRKASDKNIVGNCDLSLIVLWNDVIAKNNAIFLIGTLG